MRNLLFAVLRDEHGASIVEYTLIAALVAVVAITGLQLFGSARDTVLSTAAASIAGQ